MLLGVLVQSYVRAVTNLRWNKRKHDKVMCTWGALQFTNLTIQETVAEYREQGSILICLQEWIF
jgi:hypothetical protein